MPKPIDELNEIANRKFAELKRQLTANSRELPKQKRADVDIEKIQKVIDGTVPTQNKSKIEETDEFFEKINVLKLRPSISLAVSFLVLAENGYFGDRTENIQKAIQILEAEL